MEKVSHFTPAISNNILCCSFCWWEPCQDFSYRRLHTSCRRLAVNIILAEVLFQVHRFFKVQEDLYKDLYVNKQYLYMRQSDQKEQNSPFVFMAQLSLKHQSADPFIVTKSELSVCSMAFHSTKSNIDMRAQMCVVKFLCRKLHMLGWGWGWK